MDGGAAIDYNHSGAQYVPDPENRYYRVGSLDRIFDPNGNLVDDGAHTHTFDYRNRLIEVRDKVSGALILRSDYDGVGRRVRLSSPTQDTKVTYDGSRTISLSRENPAVTREFVYGYLLDELIVARGGGADDVRCHQDSTGSVFAATSDAGDVLERMTYDWYGAPSFIDVSSGSVSSTSSHGIPIAFAGAVWDGETGLYYMRARHYDPTVGVFLVQDPARNAVTMDWRFGTYGYSENDPADKIDPFGLWAPADHIKITMEAVNEIILEEGESIDGQTIADCNAATDDGLVS